MSIALSGGMGAFLNEYDLFIPVSPRRPKKPVALALARVRAQILKFFGGLTETRRANKGLWKIGPVTVKDEIQVWQVLSDKGNAGDRFIIKIRKILERELNQDMVLVLRRRVRKI